MSVTLAVKYRPKTWDDVTEQSSVKTILQNQLANNAVKNAYLFCGGAGTGKTTCARIFANEINHGKGNPIEMDAASNSGVDDVRNIIQQAQHKSIDSDYKVFIIDECHSISNTGWQAFLKLLEEPPATSIFIFCTTNPECIPKTILSRVQRYDFQRISQSGIVKRLEYILSEEWGQDAAYYLNNDRALEYIAKQATGGMRDAITMLDQCLSYSNELTLDNVLKALGLESVGTMQSLAQSLIEGDALAMIECVEQVHSSGHDLKQFMKSFLDFLLNVQKVHTGCPNEYINLPLTEALSNWIRVSDVAKFISPVLRINNEIRWDSNPKMLIEAMLLEEIQ